MKNTPFLLFFLLFINACMTPDPLIEEELEELEEISKAASDYIPDVESRYEKQNITLR